MFRTLLLLFFASGLTAQTAMLCPPTAAIGTDSCPVTCILCNLNGYTGTTNGYTASAESNFCSTVENDQWLGFRAMADSVKLVITPTNCQNNNGLEAAIYTQCTGQALVCAPGQNGGGALPLTLKTLTTPGQNYFLRIDGYGGDHCQFNVAVSPTNAAQVPLPGPAGTISGNSAVSLGSASAYSIPTVPNATDYLWTVTAGAVLINGQTPPLTLPAPSGNQVNVTLNSQDATICVTPVGFCGTGAAACKHLFVLTPPIVLPLPCPAGTEPSEDCATACAVCDFTGYVGSTANWAAGNVSDVCSPIQNDQWIGFLAGSSHGATFTVTPSNCLHGNGVQVALYGGCGEPFLACNGGGANMGNEPVSVSSALIPGKNYYLLIDGFSGDECDFTVSVNPPLGQIVYPVEPLGALSGPTTACPFATVTYSVPPADYAGAYIWTIPPGATVNGQPSGTSFAAPGGHIVEVTFGAQSGQVCITAVNSCAQGGTACKSVSLQPIPPTILPKVTLCNEELPYTLPWGDIIQASGNYLHLYSSYLGCDSVVRQQVSVWMPNITNLVPKVVCQGSCLQVCGEEFCDPGQYQKVCTSFMGCDSVVNFILTVLNPQAEILATSTLLNCAHPSITLNSVPSAPGSIKVWKKLNGAVLSSNTSSLTVSKPDTIVLTATQTQGGVSCAKADTIIILKDLSLPTATAAASGTLTCQQPLVQLLGSSNTPGALFAWSGPDGFSSHEMSPIINLAGIYTLLVSNPVSQCSAMATIEVLANGSLPSVAASGGTLTCAMNSVELLAVTTVQSPAFSWSGPGGFSSNQANPTVTVAGSYNITVTDGSNGCLAAATALVLIDTIRPMAAAIGDTLRCNHLIGTITAANSAFYLVNWAGPAGFSSSNASAQVNLPGDYLLTVTDPTNGCSATAIAIVTTEFTPPTVSLADDTLTCFQPSLMLHATTSATDPSYLWSGPLGIFSSDPNPEITEPGTYTVTITDGFTGCTATASATVLISVSNPQLTTSGSVIDCFNPSVTIFASTTAANPGYVWSGPNGFTSTEANPVVTVPGTYTVIVTDGNDGCTESSTAIITIDTIRPTISASGGDFTCTGTPPTLSGSSTTSGVTFLWTGPGIPNPTPNPVVTQPGIYTLTVTAQNGCTSTAEVSVGLGEIPTVDILQVTNDQNGQGLGAISITVNTSGSYSVVWTLNGQFFSNAQNLTNLMAGLYVAAVTNTDSCTAITSATVDNIVATAEPATAALWEVLPNPASTFIDVRFRGDARPEAQLSLFDMLGQKVLAESMIDGKTARLELKNLPAGQYQLLIQDRGKTVLRPVVVQR